MKKFFLCALIISTLIIPSKNAHAMDPKGKAFLIICTYGTVGGALLGFASMAFGTNSRAIAQGASLGLYAGIAFGSYVISSHGKGGDQPVEDPYQNQPPPPGYGDPGYGTQDGGFGNPGGYGAPADGGGYGAPPPQQEPGGFFGTQRILEISDDLHFNYKLKNKKGRDFSPPVYINLLNARF